MQLEFNVNKQHIKRTDTNRVVEKSRNYLTAHFTFSEEWDGKVKTAIFKNGDVVYRQPLSEDACLVPWEVILRGSMIVSVFAGNRITSDEVSVYIGESGYEEGKTPEPPTPDVYEQIITMIQNIESGDVSEEQIAKAVEKYLSEHPVETLTEEDVQQIVSTYVTEHKEELKGEKGDKGDPGAPGSNGVDGDDGLDGKSAYDIAVSHGYTGTEDEWLESLKGDPGEDGYTPVKGTDYWTAEDIAEMQSYIDSQIGGALNASY